MEQNTSYNTDETYFCRDDFENWERQKPTVFDFELTEKDFELAHTECVLQHATAEKQITGMYSGLEYTKLLAFSKENFTADEVIELMHDLFEMIEPGRGRGWRKIPVTFKDGSEGEKPENLPRTMEKWAEAYADERLDPMMAYYYFEKHHPREDGNGRVGFCLWALASKLQEGRWPEALPPDMFGEGKRTVTTFRTNLGEVEDPEYVICK